jgi:hypothetical protein
MDNLEKQGKKGVQHRYDNNGSIDPGMRKLAQEETEYTSADFYADYIKSTAR